ncbi:putative quinone oxidoreductase [Smittium culicis]|uniref:Probable quinone oxidoreductase n=1 Tax=Smittium culicis TaxID=133412 RepID=A0A1R1X7C5_9FUNG|nr:putative quinone oxidoreductase [Smittium culicis]
MRVKFKGLLPQKNINCRGMSSLKMMNAIQISKTGGVDVLEYTKVKIPEVKAGQVLVKNAFSGVNYIDTYFRTGLYPTPLPTLLGREGAGVVEEVGEGVAGFKKGDRVAYLANNSTYAEFTSADSVNMASVPEGMGLDSAAAMMITGLTALSLAKRSYQVKKGDIILIHAAAGSTGLILTQLCKHLGATVIGTTSSEAKAKIAIDAGADHIIYYNKEDVATRVREITNGQMVHAVFDGVGKSTFQGSFDSLRRLGTLVSFGNASGKVPPIEINMLAKGNITLLRPMLYGYIATEDEFRQATSELFGLIESKVLKFNICKVFGLSEAIDAHKFIESRLSTGKVLISIP